MLPALDLAACSATAWQATPDLPLRAPIVGALMVVAGWAAGHRPFPGQRSFMALTLVMAGWLASSITEHAAVDAGCKGTVALFSWAFIASQPLIYALFLHQHLNTDASGPRPHTRLLMALPVALMVLLAWTNGSHGLFYGPQTRLGEPIAGLPRLRYDYGPLFAATLTLSYAWTLAALVLVVRGLLQSRGDHRTPWLGFLVMTLVPLAANVAYLGFGWRLMGADPTSTGFAVAAFGMAVLIGRNRMFTVVPLARQRLFAQLPDPVLVLDARRTVRDANEAALRLAPAGAALDQPLEHWPRVGAALCRHLASGGDGELVLEDPPAWYEVQRQALGDPLLPVGELLQLHDVSRRHQAHDEALRTLAARQAELERASASQEELRDQALRDALTGLPNRRALQARHAELAADAAAAQRPLSLVLIDLDHFKRVNDTYGHLIGDAVLREFAALLAGSLRAGDLPHRIGGEEFALLVPGATPEVAARRLESIRAALADRPLAGMAEAVTFSAGVSGVATASDRGLDDLLAEADGALYRAKREGRDRTVLAG